MLAVDGHRKHLPVVVEVVHLSDVLATAIVALGNGAVAFAALIAVDAHRQGAVGIAQFQVSDAQVEGTAWGRVGFQADAVVAQVAQIEADERAGQARAVAALTGDAVRLDSVETETIVFVARLVGQAAAQGNAWRPGQVVEALADFTQRRPATGVVAGAGDTVVFGVVDLAIEPGQFYMVVTEQRRHVQVIGLEEQPVAHALEVVAVFGVVTAVVVFVHQAHAGPVAFAPAVGVFTHQVGGALFAVGQAVDVAVVVVELLPHGQKTPGEGVVVVEAQRLQAVVPPDAVVIEIALAADRQREARVIAEQVAFDVQLAQFGVPAFRLFAVEAVAVLVLRADRLAGVVVQPQAAIDHPLGPALFRRVPGKRWLVAQAVEHLAAAADFGVFWAVTGLHGELVEELRRDDRRTAVVGHHPYRFSAVGLGAGDFFCGHGRVQRRQGQQGAEQGVMRFHRVVSFNRSARAARARSMSSFLRVFCRRLSRLRAPFSPSSTATWA
ncbi:hypothetical protein D3C78_921550 [compost metagenome]